MFQHLGFGPGQLLLIPSLHLLFQRDLLRENLLRRFGFSLELVELLLELVELIIGPLLLLHELLDLLAHLGAIAGKTLWNRLIGFHLFLEVHHTHFIGVSLFQGVIQLFVQLGHFVR